jgi:pyridinium-3,5-bisthiocarboxylic acid mononucleotide nickel chelatase
VRRQLIERLSLARETRDMVTRFGLVRVKLALFDGKPLRLSPEYEDCKRLAEQYQVPLREVLPEVERCATTILNRQ